MSSRHVSTSAGRLSSERGSALLLLAVILAAMGCLAFAQQFVMLLNKKSFANLYSVAQAENVARGGLTDTVAWFRRQNSQPVRINSKTPAYPYADAAFDPQQTADPATSDTEQQSVGIVKEYQISAPNSGSTSSIWARYEVRRQNTDPAVSNDPHAVHDITQLRSANHFLGEGMVWYIESLGIIYKKVEPSSVPYDQGRNKILARSRVSTEIWHLTLFDPQSAVVIQDRGMVTLSGTSRINSEIYAIGYYDDSGLPTINGSGTQINGGTGQYHAMATPAEPAITTVKFFGASPEELKQMADLTVDAANIPTPFPQRKFVWIDGNTTFNSSTPMGSAAGILYVDGDLTITSGANAVFSGLLFVNGNVTLSGTMSISGALVTTKRLNMNGPNTDIKYDAGILNMVRQQMVQYRQNKATSYVSKK